MGKKELTLEELQAKKTKRQCGWVRFCAIVLAILLTGSIYKVAVKGGPRKQKLFPKVVQVNGPVVQKEEPTTQDVEAVPDAPEEAPKEDAPAEEGGFLDKILGLLGGFDPSSILEMLGPIFDQLGSIVGGGGDLGVVADKIDSITDQALTEIDKFQDSINPITAPKRPATELPFGAAMSDEALRQEVATYMNAFSQKVVDQNAGYTMKRSNTYTPDGHTDIGAQTGKVNEIVMATTGSRYCLDDIVLAFTHGSRGGSFSTMQVAKNQTVDGMIAGLPEAEAARCEGFKLAQIAQTALTSADTNNVRIAADENDPNLLTVTFDIKGVSNPDRGTKLGLGGITQDFVDRDEAALLLKNATAIQGNEFGVLKLIDMDMTYYNTQVTLLFDKSTLFNDSIVTYLPDGSVASVATPVAMQYHYYGGGKFVVRNNAVKVTGKAKTVTTTT